MPALAALGAALVIALRPILVWFARVALVGFVFRLMTALGVGLATYTGVSLIFDNVHDYVLTTLAGLPGVVLHFVERLGLYWAIEVVFSAYAFAFVLHSAPRWISTRGAGAAGGGS